MLCASCRFFTLGAAGKNKYFHSNLSPSASQFYADIFIINPCGSHVNPRSVESIFQCIFLCSDSGDWGRPSASIVCRFPRNLWERDTVLAEVEFCPLGASLFPSHQARYFCSLVVQGIASVLVKISVGVIGAELLPSYVSQHSILKNCNARIPSLLE